MSLPTVLFVAESADAAETMMNDSSGLESFPAEDTALSSSVDTLILAELWLILSGEDGDPVELMDEFTEVGESDEAWLHQLPQDLVIRLAGRSDEELMTDACEWVKEEEMEGTEPEEACQLLREARRIARRAVGTSRPMFLHISL